MLQTYGRELGDFLRLEELKEFPCEDLRTIDGLWVKYSEGKFGFSVQKEIWQSCGSPKTSGKEWDDFCIKVGWQDAGATRYLDMQELKADPHFSPTGEFPCLWLVVVVWGGLCGALFSRIQTCKL